MYLTLCAMLLRCSAMCLLGGVCDVRWIASGMCDPVLISTTGLYHYQVFILVRNRRLLVLGRAQSHRVHLYM